MDSNFSLCLDPREVRAEEVQHDLEGAGHEGLQQVLRGPQPLQRLQGGQYIMQLDNYFQKKEVNIVYSLTS